MIKKYIPLVLLFLVAGCSLVPPSTNVHQPMTARPVRADIEHAYPKGSIYNSATARPLFEDYKASRVGDTITVKITESTNASTKSNSNTNSTGSSKASVDALQGLPGKGLLGMNLGASRDIAFSGKGEANNNNVFTGTMTATVIEVLENGNLLVSGEKQLGISQQTEYVRVSGVVNPRYIVNNTVESARIADARIELKSSGYVSESQVMGWFSRFFMNILPF